MARIGEKVRETHKVVTIVSRSPEETMCIGENLGKNLVPGDVVALIGDLGTGKTCLTRGIARGMGVSEDLEVTSPTFTLINEYPGRLTLYHFDLYRIDGIRELQDVGYEEYFWGDGVSVIEWAEKIADFLPNDTFFIHLEYLDENERKFTIAYEKKKEWALSELMS